MAFIDPLTIGHHMSRLPRFNVPDLPYHVIQRGNDRCVTFAADTDYGLYLDCLRDAAEKAGCAVHAYVLMTNHVHILASPTTPDGLGTMMPSVGRRSVRHFNDAHRRQRHLVGRPLQSGAHGWRAVSADLLPIYRTEPGAGRDGVASGRVPLVQLA